MVGLARGGTRGADLKNRRAACATRRVCLLAVGQAARLLFLKQDAACTTDIRGYTYRSCQYTADRPLSSRPLLISEKIPLPMNFSGVAPGCSAVSTTCLLSSTSDRFLAAVPN